MADSAELLQLSESNSDNTKPGDTASIAEKGSSEEARAVVDELLGELRSPPDEESTSLFWSPQGCSDDQVPPEDRIYTLEDFYIVADSVNSVVFREDLEIVLWSNPQEVNGTLKIVVTKIEGKGDGPPTCFLVRISGKAFECGTSITACVSTELLTIHETRCEDTQNKEHHMYVGCEGHQYYCVTRVFVDDKLLDSTASQIPIMDAKNLIAEGANVILLRQMALKGFKGELKTSAILADGRICPSTYSCPGKTVVCRDGEELTLYTIKREVGSHTLMTTLTCAGQLVEHEWVGSLGLVRVSPHKKVTNIAKGFVESPIPLEDQWESDMELASCFLDQKDLQIASHKSYLADNPEVKALIADFVQGVLMFKPDDVMQFAVDYFSAFTPDMEMTKAEDYKMAAGLMDEIMTIVMRHINEKEMAELLDELVNRALDRCVSKDLLDSLQHMISSSKKLSEIVHVILDLFMEEADDGMVSGFLAIILRSAVKYEGPEEVSNKLKEVLSTDAERELVGQVVQSLLLEDSEQIVVELLQKLLRPIVEKEEIAAEILEDVIDYAVPGGESEAVVSGILERLVKKSVKPEEGEEDSEEITEHMIADILENVDRELDKSVKKTVQIHEDEYSLN